jgi:flagellar export protein FliJ
MESRKLKRMLELKKRIEQAKKGEMSEARQEVDAAQHSLASAKAEQQRRIAALAEESELTVSELLDRARHVTHAGEQVFSAHAKLAERNRELAVREEAVVLATRDVRTFERLTEKDKEQQRAVQKSLEQRAADDIASSRRSIKV